MPRSVPLEFTVDVEGGLLNALESGSYDLSVEDYVVLDDSHVGEQVNAHGDVFASLGGGMSIVRHGAFVAAGYCALDAFGRGSLPQDFQQATYKQFRLASLPACVITGEPTDRQEAFRRLAGDAFARHPEAQQLGRLMVERQCKADMPEAVQEASLAGFGYILDRLDTSWGRAREGICARVAREEFGPIKDQLENFSW